MNLIKKVLDFWFTSNLKLNLSAQLSPIPPACFGLWFGSAPETDKLITETFHSDIISLAADPALQSELVSSPEGAMACIIIFDQFTRNVFRNQSDAFKYDQIALKTAKIVRQNSWDLQMNPIYRGFAYLVTKIII